MADNYLEKREQEIREGAHTKVVRHNPSLESLLKRNRSYRAFSSRKVTEAELKEMVKTVTWCASGMNAQPLRFKLVTDEASIVVCSNETGREVDIDLGIAAQSILLKATEMGLCGHIILDFDADKLADILHLPLKPIAVIAIGKPAETVFLIPAHEGDSLNCYDKDGVHYVPKLQVDDLIL